MRIAKTFSHFYAEEYLSVHHKSDYRELLRLIRAVRIESKPEISIDQRLLTEQFREIFYLNGWRRRREYFCVSTNPLTVNLLEVVDFQKQKELVRKTNEPFYASYNEVDFIKNRIAVGIHLGNPFAVTYDLFVKHLSFYTGQIIDVGIEVVPTKKMQQDMSSGPPWFEKEVYNVLRHGRTNPPVPLLIIGIEP